MLNVQTRPVVERLKDHAAERGWTYEGPRTPAMKTECIMVCNKGHRVVLPASAFLFTPAAECPTCVRTTYPPVREKDHTAKERQSKAYNPLHNTRMLSHADAVARIRDDAEVTLLSQWAGVDKNHNYSCPTCGAHWSELGQRQLTSRSGCPSCKPRRYRAGTVPLVFTFPETPDKENPPA